MLCSMSLEIRFAEHFLPFFKFLDRNMDSSGCVMGLLRMSKSVSREFSGYAG